MDDLSTASEVTFDSSQTSSVMVLDLPTSTSETTATEDRLTTVPVLELMETGDTETSAGAIYEGEPPIAESVPEVESVPDVESVPEVESVQEAP